MTFMDNNRLNTLTAETARELAEQDQILQAFAATLDTPVTRIDTHASVIFLSGSRAYKFKRAVRYPYLDYSTREKRRAACEKELAINKAISPALYIGCAPLLYSDGNALLNEKGPYDPALVAEWGLIMHRFGDGDLLSTRADQNQLSRQLVEQTSRMIAGTHLQATEVTKGELHGGGCAQFNEMIGDTLSGLTRQHDPDTSLQLARIATIMAAQITGFEQRLDTRLADGWVRHCHGDLHLANICLFNDTPTLFDAVEFNDTISNIDCLYDASFLWMDLMARGHRDLANNALNTYLPYVDHYEDSGLIGLYMAARALIRARVSYTQLALLEGADAKQKARRDARHYLDLVEQCLAQNQPSLTVVGGLSGSGKTTVARAISPHIGAGIGAIHIRSDVVRKRLNNVDPLTPLPSSAYTKFSSALVYQTMLDQAREALRAGLPVILDAVYAHDHERAETAQLAEECGVPHTGIWLNAPLNMRVDRVAKRNNDASDADVNVARAQEGTCILPNDWLILNGSGDKTCIRNKAFKALEQDGHRVALDMDQRDSCCTSVS